MIVCLAGHPSVDRTYQVENVRPGEVHRPGVATVVPGGKGLNAARAIRRLGGTPHALAILSGHAGRWMADALTAEGIAGTFVWTPGETRTSVSVAASGEPEAGMTEFYEGSPSVPAAAWPELERAGANLFARAELVCLCGSLIPGAPSDGYRRVTEQAHELGAPVAIDSHGPGLLEALTAAPELVKLNVAEAAEALTLPEPSKGERLAWAASAATEVRALAGDRTTCVITCGTEGMVSVDGDGAVHRGHLDHVGRYPVGSGDAVLAALSLGLVGGMPAREALAAALGAGGANAELPGPGSLDPDRARALARQATVEPATSR